MTTVMVRNGENDLHRIVVIQGRFMFDTRNECLKVLELMPEGITRVTIDMTRTDYLDSAALGMLIQARQKLAGVELGLKVKSGSPVSQIVEVANFHQIFAYEAV
ncbi:MAG: STAS domain-containing protein [Chromatiaceae bacterium]|nr:STAS domain-containing protein [Gammaproteobacteria bacterium]MCP5306113.1 STAS domain-containing protein [Chromatiaceae bacterium]MCP5315971.1 STAS domain-containing protein [Chromatiaceae bacterium]